jgi:glycosyltransferase involved in cell wall biosynthesis
MRRPFIVLDEHWYWRENLLMRLLWPVARLIACNATFLIVPGIRAKKFWDFVGIPKRKVRVVNFDASILEPEEKHVKLSSKIRSVLNNKKIILYFGRLVKRKGVDFLIRAFAKLSKDDKDVVLLIAGEGVERGNLQRLCKELGLDGRVYFMGFANQDDKAAYFLACDIFVCPSITLGMPEIWGIVVDEAISLGKPVVVTTAVGSAYDLVRHGVNGYIVPEKNVDALCKAIKLILSDKNLRISMGKASKKLSEKITYRAFRSLDESIKSALLRTVPYMQ